MFLFPVAVGRVDSAMSVGRIICLVLHESTRRSHLPTSKAKRARN